MELLSAPLHTGSVPWQRLLLTVSLVTYWSSPTTAQVHIEPVPSHIAEGMSVLLRVSNLPENVPVIFWYKGKTISSDSELARYVISTNVNKTGPAHSGRETIFPNGSLLIQNVNQKDSGFYTLQTITRAGDTRQTSVQLHIHLRVTQPSIKVIDTKQESTVLTCQSDGTVTSIRWLFNGQNLQLTDRMSLSQKNSRLTIDSIRKEDAGEYQCEVSNLASSSKSDVLSLVVIEQSPQRGLPVPTVILIVTGVVLGVALVNALGCFLFLTKTSRASVQHDLREPKPPVSTAGPGTSDHYTLDPTSTRKEGTPVYQDLLKPCMSIYGRINHTADVSS